MNWCTFCQTYHTSSSCCHPANPSGQLNPDPSYFAHMSVCVHGQWEHVCDKCAFAEREDELATLRQLRDDLIALERLDAYFGMEIEQLIQRAKGLHPVGVDGDA